MVEDSISDDELLRMDRAGVRALRLDLFLRAQWPLTDIVAYIKRSVRKQSRSVGTCNLHAWPRRPRPHPYLPSRDRFRHRSYGLHAGKRWSDARRLRQAARSRRVQHRLDEALRPVSRRQGWQLREAAPACSCNCRGGWPSNHMGQRLAAHSKRPDGYRQPAQPARGLVPGAALRTRILCDNPAWLYGFR